MPTSVLGMNRSARESSNLSNSVANPRVVRLAVFGASGVGKSAIVKQFVNNTFTEQRELNMVESFQKQALVGNEVVIFEILDTGQELMDVDQLAVGIDGYILVFSLTDYKSLDLLNNVRAKIRQVHQRVTNSSMLSDCVLQIPFVLVGNKLDLVHTTKLPIEVEDRINWFYAPFILSSAKTGEGINDVFMTIVREIDRPKETSPSQSQLARSTRRLLLARNFLQKKCSIL